MSAFSGVMSALLPALVALAYIDSATATTHASVRPGHPCARRIPGHFKGQHVYETAVRELTITKSVASATFLEVSSRSARDPLGAQSSCYMTWALNATKSKNVSFGVVNAWHGSSAVSMKQPSSMISLIDNVGKGDYQLAWAYYVRRYGLWNRVTKVIRDDPNAAARFADKSVDFVYITLSGEQHPKDLLEQWWPKLRQGGRMCGGDSSAPSVQKATAEFFSSSGSEVAVLPEIGSPVRPLPSSQWCAYKSSTSSMAVLTVKKKQKKAKEAFEPLERSSKHTSSMVPAAPTATTSFSTSGGAKKKKKAASLTSAPLPSATPDVSSSSLTRSGTKKKKKDATTPSTTSTPSPSAAAASAPHAKTKKTKVF